MKLKKYINDVFVTMNCKKDR